jgi:hypothetical protein
MVSRHCAGALAAVLAPREVCLLAGVAVSRSRARRPVMPEVQPAEPLTGQRAAGDPVGG